MDTAVPLGIIINELVSNALKHAFSKGEDGEICIRLHRNRRGSLSKRENYKNAEDQVAKCEKIDCTGINSSIRGKNKIEDRLTLIVRDDGKGFPKYLDFRNTDSLGLQLVTALVDQINGSIELDTSRGTEFKIIFQELKYKPGV
jgi:two-component sensor histidine kinase